MMLKYLIEKEFKQFIRHPFLPKVVVIFPIFVMFVMPWAVSFDIRHIKVAIIDSDRSGLSKELTDRVVNSTYFDLAGMPGGYQEGKDMIGEGSADMIVVIPDNFERDFMRDGHCEVLVEVNSVNSMKGGLAGAYIALIINKMSAEKLLELQMSEIGNTAMLADSSEDPAGSENQMGIGIISPTINLNNQYVFNPLLDSKYAMLPALTIVVLVLVCGFMPALNIVQEKENGTIEQINVTPVRKFSFVMAKLIPYWLVGFFVLTLCFGIMWLVYGQVPVGSFLTIYLFAFLFVLAITGFGLIISNYSNTLQQAMFLVFFFVIIFILISGLLTPIASMPNWAKVIATVSPPRYFISAMRSIYLKGSGVSDLLPQLRMLILMSVVFFGWAIISYRKKSK